MMNKFFNRVAKTYDRFATVHEKIASHLINYVTNLPKKPQRIIEIGCGTGILTEKLISLFPFSEYIAIDASASMIEQCKKKLKKYQITHIRSNAEFLDMEGDLIASSMVFHWFEDCKNAISNIWQKTNSSLIFSIPLKGTFETWNDMLFNCGITVQPIDLFAYDELRSILLELKPNNLVIEEKQFEEHFETAFDFLYYLHRMGIHKAKNNVIDIRPLLSVLEKPITITYKIAFCALQKAL